MWPFIRSSGVWVDGQAGYQRSKSLFKMLMSSALKTPKTTSTSKLAIFVLYICVELSINRATMMMWSIWWMKSGYNNIWLVRMMTWALGRSDWWDGVMDSATMMMWSKWWMKSGYNNIWLVRMMTWALGRSDWWDGVMDSGTMMMWSKWWMKSGYNNIWLVRMMTWALGRSDWWDGVMDSGTMMMWSIWWMKSGSLVDWALSVVFTNKATFYSLNEMLFKYCLVQFGGWRSKWKCILTVCLWNWIGTGRRKADVAHMDFFYYLYGRIWLLEDDACDWWRWRCGLWKDMIGEMVSWTVGRFDWWGW